MVRNMAESSSPDRGVHRRDVLPNRREAINRATQSVVESAEEHGFDAASCFAIRLALEETLSNAYKHGNREHPDKTVTLECSIDPQRIVIEVEDEGPGFDPEIIPDPTAEENLEIPSGRGLVLVQSFMTEVEFVPPGNKVRLVYERPAQQSDQH